MRDGELNRADRVRTAAGALAVQTASLPHLFARRRPTAAVVDPASVPDSRLCRDALDEARSELAPPVLAHSLRCWEFAVALAEVDGLTFDPEGLYVATMLHDIALGAPEDTAIGCFALLGADRARGFVTDRGGSADRAACVHTAIARHMDVRTPAGSEAALLHDAAHLDVVGLRWHELDPAVLQYVERTHPRTGFKSEFAAAMRMEARLRPNSTAATLWKCGMRVALALNPLDR